MSLSEIIKQKLIDAYKSIGDDIALLTKDKKSYTGYAIANEIEKETEFGISMINNILKLTIDLLSRNKLEIDL